MARGNLRIEPCIQFPAPPSNCLLFSAALGMLFSVLVPAATWLAGQNCQADSLTY